MRFHHRPSLSPLEAPTHSPLVTPFLLSLTPLHVVAQQLYLGKHSHDLSQTAKKNASVDLLDEYIAKVISFDSKNRVASTLTLFEVCVV